MDAERAKLEAVEVGLKLVLDCVDLGLPECSKPGLGMRYPRKDAFIQRCQEAWKNFKTYNRDAAHTVATHALAVVRSHYPSVRLEAVGAGYARRTTTETVRKLESDVEEAATELAGDVDQFGEDPDVSADV